tara:strand:+ start:199 stop:780 length:582 start_codon:yes stop_codon:yes gene_type:complete
MDGSSQKGGATLYFSDRRKVDYRYDAYTKRFLKLQFTKKARPTDFIAIGLFRILTIDGKLHLRTRIGLERNQWTQLYTIMTDVYKYPWHNGSRSFVQDTKCKETFEKLMEEYSQERLAEDLSAEIECESLAEVVEEMITKKKRYIAHMDYWQLTDPNGFMDAQRDYNAWLQEKGNLDCPEPPKPKRARGTGEV